MKDLIGWMLKHSRGFTKEEAEAHEACLHKISRPTGRNFFDMVGSHAEGVEGEWISEDLNIKDEES